MISARLYVHIAIACHCFIYQSYNKGRTVYTIYDFNTWGPGKMDMTLKLNTTSQWRHNGRDCVSNHQPHDCLLKRLFRRRSKKISQLLVTGFCVGNSLVTGVFPAQRASKAEMFPFDDVIMHKFIFLINGVLINSPRRIYWRVFVWFYPQWFEITKT